MVRLLCDRVLVMYLGKIVESGPAVEVFEHPLHPYTQALVAAVPRLHENGNERLRLDGEPRSPIDPDPNVCRFYGRCPRGTDLCKTTMPALRASAPARSPAISPRNFCRRRERCHETKSRPQDRRALQRARRRKSALASKQHDNTPATRDPIDALVAASAQALGLAIDPAWQPSVKFNLHLILRHAALVDEFPLPDDAEPAPIFQA